MTVLAKPAETPRRSNMISIAGVELEMLERGHGAPLLYLHGGAGFALDAPFIDLLARERRIIAPSHPGFGRSSLPDWLDSVDDIAHIYLELMDRLGLKRTDVVGLSIGGIPQARTETIAEAGHLPQVEQPAATAAKVLHFLQSTQATETSGARS